MCPKDARQSVFSQCDEGWRARIDQGIHSGSLTAREAARLERQHAALDRQIRRDRLDGGGLTLRERRMIDRRQDRLSRRIYRQKHNAQHR